MTQPNQKNPRAIVCTVDQFAIDTGLSIDSIRKKISLGQLPTVKIGRSRMINLMRLAQIVGDCI